MTHTPLRSQIVAEAVGTSFLTMSVIGSGIAAQRLSPDDVGLQLLENSVVTGCALVALILTFGTLSAAFNPVVTAVDLLHGKLGGRAAASLIAAQVIGGGVGAVLANLMFGLDAVSISHHHRATGGALLAEIIATTGLLLVIFGGVRSGRADSLPYAVGGYITAAYWFTSSTSFANPAITIARTLSDTFAGISPGSVSVFIAMQLVGMCIAVSLIRSLWPEKVRA